MNTGKQNKSRGSLRLYIVDSSDHNTLFVVAAFFIAAARVLPSIASRSWNSGRDWNHPAQSVPFVLCVAAATSGEIMEQLIPLPPAAALDMSWA